MEQNIACLVNTPLSKVSSFGGAQGRSKSAESCSVRIQPMEGRHFLLLCVLQIRTTGTDTRLLKNIAIGRHTSLTQRSSLASKISDELAGFRCIEKVYNPSCPSIKLSSLSSYHHFYTLIMLVKSLRSAPLALMCLTAGVAAVAVGNTPITATKPTTYTQPTYNGAAQPLSSMIHHDT